MTYLQELELSYHNMALGFPSYSNLMKKPYNSSNPLIRDVFLVHCC